MDAFLIIAFYGLVAVLIIRVRRFHLALAVMALNALLLVALVLEATVSERIGGLAALGALITSVVVALAFRFGGWIGAPKDGSRVRFRNVNARPR